MLWYKKQAKDAAPLGRDVIRPGELAVSFDEGIFAGKVKALVDAVVDKGGVEPLLAALNTKQQLFSAALSAERIAQLTQDDLAELFSSMFTVRRKLADTLAQVPHERMVSAISDLLHGEGALRERMQALRELAPQGDAKARRALWDAAAELLHFNSPEHYPLMTRWVWDQGTVSGALRELIRGNDALPEIPLSDAPETFEAARVWVAARWAEHGFYRDVHFLIDLSLAQAYADYMFGMSKGLGMFGAEFGPQTEPIELVLKLLGIDAGRPGDKPKLKRHTQH